MGTSIVKQYYDYFNSRNWDGMLSCLTDDIRHDVNEGDVEIGREKFKKFLQMMDQHYSEKVKDLCLMSTEKGERVAAEFVIDGIYNQTAKGLPEARGQRYQLPVGAFFEVQNGRIARVTNYYNLKKWIQLVQQ